MSPSIPPEFRPSMIGLQEECPVCLTMRIKHYCRSCDVFWIECECTDGAEHITHRVYLWTPTGIIAIPDFDNFPFEGKP